MNAAEVIAELREELADTRAALGEMERRSGELLLDVGEREVEICELRAVLQAIIDDIHDYERVNHLAPNPPRMECWDSVAHARAALEGK